MKTPAVSESIIQGPVLAVFDFDGTLTRRDSFVPFLRFAFGTRRFVLRMLRMALPGARYLLGAMSRDQLKARLIKEFLTGARADWVEQEAERFCDLFWPRLMRTKGLRSVAEELANGATVTLCSASPEMVLRPFARKLGVELIGTELVVENGFLTGEINGDNCRGNFKVVRLAGVYGELNRFRIRAWGDTRGDHELLAVAHDAHWRLFHPVWRRGRYLKAPRRMADQGAEAISSTQTIELPAQTDTHNHRSGA